MNKIKSVPIEDRPYEKFKLLGEKALSESELLAIILKTGTKNTNCVELAKQILSKHSNGMSGFRYIEEASISELMQHSGIGYVKAIQLKAIIEIAKRITRENNKNIKTKIRSPKDVFDYISCDMKDRKTEEVRVILLDNKNYIKSSVTIALGATNKTTISVKEVLSEPIKHLATGIILVHNHPSGDTTPSRQDVIFTRKIIEYASIFEIELLDHIIVGSSEYTSIKQTNTDLFLRGKIT